jgi:hypothetical protein
MIDVMARAVFHREFNWSRPKSKFSFSVKPSPEPQLRPHDVIEAAVAAGAATRDTTKRRRR